MPDVTLQVDFRAPWHRYLSYSPFLNLMEAAAAEPTADGQLPAAILGDGDARPDWPASPLRVFVENDLHRHTDERLDQLRSRLGGYDLSLCPYRFAALPDWPPHLEELQRAGMAYCPHSVPASAPLPRAEQLAEVRGFAVEPRDPRPYPWLWRLQELGLPGMTWQRHPGYSLDTMAAAREQWFPTLAQHQIGLVGLGWGPRGYVLAKYFEYLYAGMLLIAEPPPSLERELLGLRHGENCLLFRLPQDEKELVATYRSALVDFAPFAPIAAAGQALALARHRASHRLAYIRRLVAFRLAAHRAATRFEQIELFLDE